MRFIVILSCPSTQGTTATPCRCRMVYNSLDECEDYGALSHAIFHSPRSRCSDLVFSLIQPRYWHQPVLSAFRERYAVQEYAIVRLTERIDENQFEHAAPSTNREGSPSSLYFLHFWQSGFGSNTEALPRKHFAHSVNFALTKPPLRSGNSYKPCRSTSFSACGRTGNTHHPCSAQIIRAYRRHQSPVPRRYPPRPLRARAPL